jgi:disulfide bond formation protein DsbB
MRRNALILVLLGGIAVIAGAWAFQVVGGLVPCELCLYERWPYYIGIPVAVLALLAGRRRAPAVSLIALLALVFIASSALAFYHVGVEKHWFEGPSACTSPTTPATTLEQLRAQLMATQPVLCDQPQWSLFGVTLAGFNFLASLVLALLSLTAFRAALSRRRS